MLEAQRPVTLLLGTLCLWALTLLALTMAGLGGRIAPITEGGEPPPPLRALHLTQGQSRLGPLPSFAEVGARPLLSADRRPHAVSAVAGDAGSATLDAIVTSILITPRLQMAVLTMNEGGQSRRVRVGENVEGTQWRLLALKPRQATFEGPSGQQTFPLRVFDGKGGVPPTRVESAATEASAVAPVATSAPGSPPEAQATPAPPSQPMSALMPAPGEKAMTQEEQVEAIRRRIEARRAQLRAQPPRDTDDRR